MGKKTKTKKEKGYIHINSSYRIAVEKNSLVLEEKIGNKEDAWGNFSYFTSWEGLMNYIIRALTTDKISKKKIWSFLEAKEEIIKTIKEFQDAVIGDVNKLMGSCCEEIKENIKKYI